MRVRKVDAAGDMQFGKGLLDFHKNTPDGVAQVVQSRLQLYTGEWFLDLSEGMAWRTEVLGKYTGPTRDMVIRDRILGSPGVTEITSYDSALNRDTRDYTAQATIATQYGAVSVKVEI